MIEQSFVRDQKLVGKDICDKLLQSFKDNSSKDKILGPPDTYLYCQDGIRIRVHRVS